MSLQLSDEVLKKIFWSLLCLILILMICYTPQYGITGDDVTQYNYGTSVWNYISSFGNDKTAVTGHYLENTQTLYGGFFDGVAAMMISIFHPKDEFLLRHYWVMLFGFLGYLATGLLAKEFGGWKAGHSKCIVPFFLPPGILASRLIIQRIYRLQLLMPLRYMLSSSGLKILISLPGKHTILMALAIGLCVSIRIGGALIAVYLILFLHGHHLAEKNCTKTKS